MLNFSDWVASGFDLEDLTGYPEERAAFAWKAIRDKPVPVVLVRDATISIPASNLDPQTVRVEVSGSAVEFLTETGDTARADIILFGVIGHPDATVLDTNVQNGDRFRYLGADYEVVQTVQQPGEVHAFGKRLA